MPREGGLQEVRRWNSGVALGARFKRGRFSLEVACLAFLLATCDPGLESTSPVTVRDSAGISIVESKIPLGDRRLSWSVDPTPALRIGAGLHGAEDALYRVRGAVRLRNGNIAVANAGSYEVRIIAMSGELESTVGGKGGGPGEFEGLSSFVSGPGDTLYAFDNRQLRIAVLDPEGGFVETRPLTGLTSRVNGLRAVLEDGSLILSPSRMLNAGTAAAVHTWIDSIPLLHSMGVEVVPVPLFDWAEMYETPTSYGMVQFGGTNYGLIVFDGEEVREASGYSGSLVFKNLRGEVRQVAKWPASLRTFESTAMLSWAQSIGTPEDRVQELSQSLREELFRYPDSVQAFDKHVVDSEGHSWLRRFLFPWEEMESDQSQWDLISPTGYWLGQVGLPPRFTPTDIGTDYLLGITRSPVGVEEVHLYHLERK